MTDWTEHGAEPVVDAAVPDPPTVDEVMAERDAREARLASGEDDDADLGDGAD